MVLRAKPKINAGYYATFGMRGAFPQTKTEIMTALVSNSGSKQGASIAVKEIKQFEPWWFKVLKVLGVVTLILPP